MEPYIRARDLAKTYPSGASELVVFSGLNLDVHRGEMLALVGESGAGKSTLLHLLGGLDRPSNGTIYYGRQEISGLADWEQADFRNRELGFVWQIHLPHAAPSGCRASPKPRTAKAHPKHPENTIPAPETTVI